MTPALRLILSSVTINFLFFSNSSIGSLFFKSKNELETKTLAELASIIVTSKSPSLGIERVSFNRPVGKSFPVTAPPGFK